MAWAPITQMGMAPDEEPREYWERVRTEHNKFAEKFNEDWMNRLMGRQIPFMPTFDQMVETSPPEIREMFKFYEKIKKDKDQQK